MTLTNRNQFGRYCDEKGYKIAVEVGVDLGLFARMLLSGSNIEKLYLVDPYLPYPEIPHERETAWETAGENLKEFDERLTWVLKKSADAATMLRYAKLPLDFVYVDAEHTYEAVSEDLAAWWPLVRPGGTLAGHDYDLPAVRRAVDEFFMDVDVPLAVLTVPADGNEAGMDENGNWAHPSWHVEKPK